jgi:peptide/nickel transport system substrate-binding protein
VVAVVAVAIGGGGDDGDETGGQPAAGGAERTLTIAMSGEIETFDSDFSRFQRSNEVNYNVQDQFFRYGTRPGDGYELYDPTKYEGSAVESWRESDEGKTIDLEVRPGTKFNHTGNPVTADDFIYWFDRSQGTKSGYLFNVDTAGITDWEKTGESSVRVRFKQRSPYFYALFRDQSQAPVDSKEMEKHATAADKWATEWKARNEAASGEYFVEKHEPGVQTVLRANPDYWDGKPYFDRVVLKVVPSSADRALLLQRGEVDIARDLSIDEVDSLRDAEGVRVLSIPTRDQYHLGMNNEKGPFKNPEVRRALSYAVPYDEIVRDVLKGEATVPKSPVARAGQFHDGSSWNYRYDIEEAKRLLEEAGYPDGFSFRLAIESGNPTTEELAILLKDRFADAGVTMQIDKQSAAVFAERTDKRQHEAWLRSILWYVDDPGYIGNTFYKCDALLNWMDYCNPEADRLIEQMTSLPIDARAEKEPLAKEFQRIVGADAPTLILAEPNLLLPMRDDIEGYVHLPDNLLWYYPLRRAEH